MTAWNNLASLMSAPALAMLILIKRSVFRNDNMSSLSPRVSRANCASAAMMSAAAFPSKCCCSFVHVDGRSSQVMVRVLNAS